ncbi:hypothetical protein RYX36_032852 [Vicia faba]
MDNVVQPLVIAVKQYLVASYKDITSCGIRTSTSTVYGILRPKMGAQLFSDQPNVDDSKARKPMNSEEDAMVEVFTAGYEASNPTNVVDSHMDFSPLLKVRTLHISSSILDWKSMFFYKFMTCCKLKTVQTCNEFNLEVTSKLVFGALFSRLKHQTDKEY